MILKNSFVFWAVIAYPDLYLASMDQPIRLHDDAWVRQDLEEIVEARLFVRATMEAKGICRTVGWEEMDTV